MRKQLHIYRLFTVHCQNAVLLFSLHSHHDIQKVFGYHNQQYSNWRGMRGNDVPLLFKGGTLFLNFLAMWKRNADCREIGHHLSKSHPFMKSVIFREFQLTQSHFKMQHMVLFTSYL